MPGSQIQTIAFLSHLKDKGINGPFMVVGPLSTLPNWVNEFARFCPALPALMYHGSKLEREELRKTRIKPPGGFCDWAGSGGEEDRVDWVLDLQHARVRC